jgi:hypothetical protein
MHRLYSNNKIKYNRGALGKKSKKHNNNRNDIRKIDKILYINLRVIFFLIISLVIIKKDIIKSLYATNFPLLYEIIRGDIIFFITFYLLLRLFLVVKVSS